MVINERKKLIYWLEIKECPTVSKLIVKISDELLFPLIIFENVININTINFETLKNKYQSIWIELENEEEEMILKTNKFEKLALTKDDFGLWIFITKIENNFE
jgi:hypothetical protein